MRCFMRVESLGRGSVGNPAAKLAFLGGIMETQRIKRYLYIYHNYAGALKGANLFRESLRKRNTKFEGKSRSIKTEYGVFDFMSGKAIKRQNVAGHIFDEVHGIEYVEDYQIAAELRRRTIQKKAKIPIEVAYRIAATYGYDQVAIIARKTGPDGGEHVTTHGITKEHASIAARWGNFLKYTVMGWIRESENQPPKRRTT